MANFKESNHKGILGSKEAKEKTASPYKQWKDMSLDEKRELAGYFDRDVQNLTYSYVRDGLNPGIAQHILHTDAIQMGFGTSTPSFNYMNVIAVMLGAMLTEVEKRIPKYMFENLDEGMDVDDVPH
ncbi:MAG: hypothetical protein ACJ0BI_01405 [Paracoccaceae bacterium]